LSGVLWLFPPSVAKRVLKFESSFESFFVCAIIIVSILFVLLVVVVYHVCLVNKDSQFMVWIRHCVGGVTITVYDDGAAVSSRRCAVSEATVKRAG